MISLSDIVTYTDDFLRTPEVGDWDNALNGLQIENSGQVTRLGAAVQAESTLSFLGYGVPRPSQPGARC